MMPMKCRAVVAMSVLAAFRAAPAEEPALGPLIADYGPTYAIAGRDVPLEPGFVYRAVFDAATHTGDAAALNVELESAARFLNMHARQGVRADRMQLAVVLHGEALMSALTDDAYRKRFGVDNPSLGLLRDLSAAGVRLYVCGQSMGFRGIAKDELADSVEVALSAMTMLTVLQSEGYALLP